MPDNVHDIQANTIRTMAEHVLIWIFVFLTSFAAANGGQVSKFCHSNRILMLLHCSLTLYYVKIGIALEQ